MHVESTSAARRARSFALQPVWFLRFAALELFALWVIVATGAAVRLTSSGLGCRHWPGCEAGHPLPAKNYHAYIEFGNRVVGGVTILITLLVALAAVWTPLGRRGKQLAAAVFVGTLAQAPLGYLAVKTDLRWPVVAAHLLEGQAAVVELEEDGYLLFCRERQVLRHPRVEVIERGAAGVIGTTGHLPNAEADVR